MQRIKIITAVAAIAGLIAGASVATAQNAPAPTNPQPSSSIDKGANATTASGSQAAPSSIQKGSKTASKKSKKMKHETTGSKTKY